MERAQPITGLKEYYQASSWNTTYPNHFANTPNASPVKASDISDAGHTISKKTRFDEESSAATATIQNTRNVIAQKGFVVSDEGLLHLQDEMVILEVFCGPNKSASKAIQKLFSNPEKFIRIITVDVNADYDPTIVVDVRNWHPTSALRDRVHFAWLSPPCTDYSPAKTTGERNLETADQIAVAALRIVAQVAPVAWVIENPTGLLRHRPFMEELAHFLQPTTYCMFDAPEDVFDYRKETDIYTNIPCPLPHCRLTPCKYKREEGKHPSTAQRGPNGVGTPGNKLETLHRVPTRLVQKLFLHAHSGSSNQPSTFLPSLHVHCANIEQGV